MSGRWHAALAYAVTGERLDLGVQDVPDPAAVAASMAELGVTPDATRRVVPPDLMAGLSYAQLTAAERRLRDMLGVTGSVRGRPSGRAPNADERRLLADRPPHWG